MRARSTLHKVVCREVLRVYVCWVLRSRILTEKPIKIIDNYVVVCVRALQRGSMKSKANFEMES